MMKYSIFSLVDKNISSTIYASNIVNLNDCKDKFNHEKYTILRTYYNLIIIGNLIIPNIKSDNNSKLEKLSSISLANQIYILDLKSEFKYQVKSNSNKLNLNKKNIKLNELYFIQNNLKNLHNQINFFFMNNITYSSISLTRVNDNKLFDLLFYYYHIILQAIYLQIIKKDYFYNVKKDLDLINKLYIEKSTKINQIKETPDGLMIEKELLERFIENIKKKILHKKINLGNMDLAKNTKSIDTSKIMLFIYLKDILKSIECKQFISNLRHQVLLTIDVFNDSNSKKINNNYSKMINPKDLLTLQLNVLNYILDSYNKQYIPHIEYNNKVKFNDISLKSIQVSNSVKKNTIDVLNFLKIKQSLGLYNLPTTNIFLSEEVDMTEDFVNNLISKHSKD